jgi:hypothetical protein
MEQNISLFLCKKTGSKATAVLNELRYQDVRSNGCKYPNFLTLALIGDEFFTPQVKNPHCPLERRLGKHQNQSGQL